MTYRDIRIVPDAKLPQDLRVIANGQCIAKIYGEDASTPREDLANEFVAHLEFQKGVGFADFTQGAPIPPPDDEFSLTEEMSLPRDFDRSDPVMVWNAENNRDAVAEIRGALRSLNVEGFDLLGHYDDDVLVTFDLLNHAEDVPENQPSLHDIPTHVIEASVARIRHDPTGVYPA